MSRPGNNQKRVAIACGGTGGHLFPGLAVAEELLEHNCAVTLLISPKEIDQQALKNATRLDVVTLPAVGLERGRLLPFLKGFRASYRLALADFQLRRPGAVLAMGGFASAPPLLAGKRVRARTFLHESNAIPGRANRWLSWLVDFGFVGFAQAGARLHARRVKVTGTPVRRCFERLAAEACRRQLGLDAARPVMLVMGGSQGATAINELVCDALPFFKQAAPDWQWVHLSGSAQVDKVKAAYQHAGLQALVQPFSFEMALVLNAATLAINRAGASSLAELAELQLPAVLIPYPAAVENHQYFNARALADAGAAVLLPQASATAESLAQCVLKLMRDEATRSDMQRALQLWRRPDAAKEIADIVLAGLSDPACLQNPFSQKSAEADGSNRGKATSPEKLNRTAPDSGLVPWSQHTPPA